MRRAPIPLLDQAELPPQQRALLEAARANVVPYDLDAGVARLEHTLDKLTVDPSAATSHVASLTWLSKLAVLPVFLIVAVYLGLRADVPKVAKVETTAPSTPAEVPVPPSELPTPPAVEDPQKSAHDGKSRPSRLATSTRSNRSSSSRPSSAVQEPRDHVQPPVRPTVEDTASVAPQPEDELLGVARARQLVSQQPQAALALLAQLARDHPHGYFVEEREALTVLALAAGGEHAQAKARAAAFLRSYPQSAFVTRVRSASER